MGRMCFVIPLVALCVNLAAATCSEVVQSTMTPTLGISDCSSMTYVFNQFQVESTAYFELNGIWCPQFSESLGQLPSVADVCGDPCAIYIVEQLRDKICDPACTDPAVTEFIKTVDAMCCTCPPTKVDIGDGFFAIEYPETVCGTWAIGPSCEGNFGRRRDAYMRKTRKCVADGVWDTFINMSHCVNTELQNLGIAPPATVDDALVALEQVRDIVLASGATFGASDISSLTTILWNINTQGAAFFTPDTAMLVASILGDVLALDSRVLQRTTGATVLNEAILFLTSANDGLATGDATVVVAPNIVFTTGVVSCSMGDVEWPPPGVTGLHGTHACNSTLFGAAGAAGGCAKTSNDTVTSSSPAIDSGMTQQSIVVPADVLAADCGVTGTRTFTAVFLANGHVFGKRSETAAAGLTVLAGSVLALTLGGIPSGTPLPAPVRLTFEKPAFVANFDASLACVFWDAIAEDWLPDGCWLDSETTTTYVCACNHTTNYAVLVDVHGAASSLSAADALALTIITDVGIGISVPLMLFVLFVYGYFANLRTLAKKILLNLVACLVLSQVLFVSTISRTGLASGCTATAVVLHYTLLAAFMWSLVQGYEIHQSFTAVFEHRNRADPLWRYVVFAYSVPAVIVIVSAAVAHHGYGTSEVCWLSVKGEQLIWAFVGPVVVIMLVNLVFFARTFFVILRIPIRRSKDEGRFLLIKRLFKGTASFFSVMSLGWVFGILMMVGENVVAFQYIFAICNAFQGLFIFLFHCWLDPAVHQRLQRWWREWQDGGVSSSSMSSRGSKSTGKAKASASAAASVSSSSAAAAFSSVDASKEWLYSASRSKNGDHTVTSKLPSWCSLVLQLLAWVVSTIGVALFVAGFCRHLAPADAILPTADPALHRQLMDTQRVVLIIGAVLALAASLCAVLFTWRAQRTLSGRLCLLTMVPLGCVAVVIMFSIVFVFVWNTFDGVLNPYLQCTPVFGAHAHCENVLTEEQRRYCQYASPSACCFTCVMPDPNCCAEAYCTGFASGAYENRDQLTSWCVSLSQGHDIFLAGFVMSMIGMALHLILSFWLGCGGNGPMEGEDDDSKARSTPVAKHPGKATPLVEQLDSSNVPSYLSVSDETVASNELSSSNQTATKETSMTTSKTQLIPLQTLHPSGRASEMSSSMDCSLPDDSTASSAPTSRAGSRKKQKPVLVHRISAVDPEVGSGSDAVLEIDVDLAPLTPVTPTTPKV